MDEFDIESNPILHDFEESEEIKSTVKSPSKSFILWLAIGSLVIILLYLILIFKHDRTSTQSRNTKHNLQNYLDYVMNVFHTGVVDDEWVSSQI